VDSQPPSGVPALHAAGTDANSIDVCWLPATDDTYAPRYQIYGSTTANFAASSTTLLDHHALASFAHGDLGTKQTWYYRVRASTGRSRRTASAPVSAVTGNSCGSRPVDAVVSSTAPGRPAGRLLQRALVQGRSSVHPQVGTQTWSRVQRVDHRSYDMSMVLTKAVDYGIVAFAWTVRRLATRMTRTTTNAVVITPPLDYGQHQLTAGKHRLT